MKHVSLWLGGVVLVLTTGIFGYARWRTATAPADTRPAAALTALLPGAMPGVAVEDLALGPNEFVDQKARDKLDYDDVFFRGYATPSGSFAVYIGHWRAGRFSPSFIAAHTPDRCWTLAGMTCLGFKSGYAPATADAALPGGEWRRFVTREGQAIHVVFWHLVGGRLHDYGGRFHSFTAPTQRVKDVIGDLFMPHGDQYFIRVSSSRPLEDFAREPAFQAVMQALGDLGLRAANDKG